MKVTTIKITSTQTQHLSIVLLVSLLLFACAQNPVDKAFTPIQYKDEAAVDKALEESMLLPEVKGILTEEQILSYKAYETNLNMTDEQVEQLEARGFSFLQHHSDEWVKEVYNDEQLDQIRRGNQVVYTPEQKKMREEAFAQLQEAAAAKFVQVGQVAPDFELVDSLGNRRKLSEFRGKFVLLDFWGTWCVPCVEELPSMAKDYEKVDKTKVEFIGVCAGCDDLEEFLQANPLEWVQLNDLVGKVSEQYQVTSYPSIILISPEGVVLETPYVNNDIVREDKVGTINKYIKLRSTQ
jgi:peroxiredoxin